VGRRKYGHPLRSVSHLPLLSSSLPFAPLNNDPLQNNVPSFSSCRQRSLRILFQKPPPKSNFLKRVRRQSHISPHLYSLTTFSLNRDSPRLLVSSLSILFSFLHTNPIVSLQSFIKLPNFETFSFLPRPAPSFACSKFSGEHPEYLPYLFPFWCC